MTHSAKMKAVALIRSITEAENKSGLKLELCFIDLVQPDYVASYEPVWRVVANFYGEDPSQHKQLTASFKSLKDAEFAIEALSVKYNLPRNGERFGTCTRRASDEVSVIVDDIP